VENDHARDELHHVSGHARALQNLQEQLCGESRLRRRWGVHPKVGHEISGEGRVRAPGKGADQLGFERGVCLEALGGFSH
jgi:hypothetical protein